MDPHATGIIARTHSGHSFNMGTRGHGILSLRMHSEVQHDVRDHDDGCAIGEY